MIFFFFSCSADHERDWLPCKVVFFGLATNALNVRNNKTFFPPDWGMLRRSRCVLFFFKQQHIPSTISVRIMNTAQHYNTLEKSYLDIKARVASLFQEKYKYMQTFWESTQPRGGGVSKRLKWKVSGAGRV